MNFHNRQHLHGDPPFVRKALRTTIKEIYVEKPAWPWLIMLCLISLNISGCGAILADKHAKSRPLGQSTITMADLAGNWEYQEGTVVYTLPLDEYGDGTYEWKKGRFHTTTFSDGVWQGTWAQEENDREGGFELHLSDDNKSAKGRWWYTRIGKDDKPLAPGGSFTLRRMNGL